jgi:hypothetical protein
MPKNSLIIFYIFLTIISNSLLLTSEIKEKENHNKNISNSNLCFDSYKKTNTNEELLISLSKIDFFKMNLIEINK